MKNVQVIDGATNSTFEIYGVPDELFEVIFPSGTDVAFMDEVSERFLSIGGDKLWATVYANLIDKKQVVGIHGTLHLTGSIARKKDFPTRREFDTRSGYE